MRRKITAAVIIIAIALPFFIKSQPTEQHITLTGELGTNSEIVLYGSKATAARCSEYIKTADALFSVSKPTSEISRLNNGEAVTLSADTAEILSLAAEYTDAESFNPFAGALFELWDNAIKSEALPDNDALSAANEFSMPVSLSMGKSTAVLKKTGQRINLGAIAKGYITNKLADILKGEDVASALINLGGNVYAYGRKPGGELWRVAVRSPEGADEYIGVISAEDTAIVTSGDYERCFTAGGESFHHIIDPKTCYPAKSGLRSVTIIAKDAALADMLSTKCFVLGLEKSKQLLAEYAIQAIFVTDNNEVYFSKELTDIFEYSNDDYLYNSF